MSVPPEEEDVGMSQTGMSWATCAGRHCPIGQPEGVGELVPEAGPEKPGPRLGENPGGVLGGDGQLVLWRRGSWEASGQSLRGWKPSWGPGQMTRSLVC